MLAGHRGVTVPNLNDMLEEAKRRTENGERLAMATIVRTRGSTPREVGAKMLVFEDGLFMGTVGGGCGEADVLQATLDAIEAGRPSMLDVDFEARLLLHLADKRRLYGLPSVDVPRRK